MILKPILISYIPYTEFVRNPQNISINPNSRIFNRGHLSLAYTFDKKYKNIILKFTIEGSDDVFKYSDIGVYKNGVLIYTLVNSNNGKKPIYGEVELKNIEKGDTIILKDIVTRNYTVFGYNESDKEDSAIKLYEKLEFKYLLKQDNKYYTIKDNELTLLENQTLTKEDFKTNGFSDLELLNSIDKTDMKLLVYDESNPDKLKLKYTLKESFRPIDKFEGKIKILKQEMK